MSRFVSVLLLLAAPAALAQEARAPDGEPLPAVPKPMATDDAPSQYSCTFDKLMNNVGCSWEFAPPSGEPNRSQAAENSKRAAVAAKGCASAATGPDDDKPDAAARKACEADIARLSLEKCSFDGRFPLEDDKGKLAVSARPCAEALMRVLAKTMTQVSGGDARAPESEESAQAPKAQPRGPKAKKTKAADAPLKI